MWSTQDMIQAAQSFTNAYKAYEDAPSAIREAKCLQAQYPKCLADIGDDLFVGRPKEVIVGYRFSLNDGDMGYYFNDKLVYSLRKNNELTIEQEAEIQILEEYWKDRTVLGRLGHVFKTPNLPREVINMLYLGSIEKDYTDFSFVANNMPRICEISLDFDLLLILGINGLRERVMNYRDAIFSENDSSMYDGMLIALDVLIDCCRYFANQAREQAANTTGEKSLEMIEIAQTLENITKAPPSSLREAIQLFWLYSQLACLDNFGRMDIYLGDFYAYDIDQEVLSEEKAQSLINALWLIIESQYPTSGRVIIGGMGRRNEQNANRFALAAMEASRVIKGTSPSLSLRLHKSQDSILFDKALATIGSGGTYPFLYNDEVLVPSLKGLLGASREDAEQYVMSNCGEITLEHRALGTPSVSMMYLKLLELVLFDGYDHYSKQAMGRKTGGLTSFESFEHLWEAFFDEVTYLLEILVKYGEDIIRMAASQSPNLFCAMLFDDCLKRNAGLIDGARYLGLTVETHMVVSAAQSLYAIKCLVYEEKCIEPNVLLDMMRKDFAGYEYEHGMLLALPQYGNNIDEIDDFVRLVVQKINAITYSLSSKTGLDYVVPTHISVDANVSLGKYALASADGRRAGTPMSNSVNPLPGRDKEGLTAMLNSVSTFPTNDNCGMVTHIKIDQNVYQNREAIAALIKTFFANGGSHLCVGVLKREELENAMRCPKLHQNLMVRIGGFSARFVTLSTEMQHDIISRTLHT